MLLQKKVKETSQRPTLLLRISKYKLTVNLNQTKKQMRKMIQSQMGQSRSQRTHYKKILNPKLLRRKLQNQMRLLLMLINRQSLRMRVRRTKKKMLLNQRNKRVSLTPQRNKRKSLTPQKNKRVSLTLQRKSQRTQNLRSSLRKKNKGLRWRQKPKQRLI